MQKSIYFIVSNMSNIGGTQRVTQVLANYFVNVFEYNVFIINVGRKNKNEKFKLDPKIKIYYCNSKLSNNSIYNLILNYRSLKKSIKELNIKNSFIIAMGIGYSYLLPFLFKETYNNKLIGMQHSVFKCNKILNFIRQFILEKLDAFITINNAMMNDTKLKLRLKNLYCIENPISFKVRDDEKSSLNNNKVLAIGRLTEEKGFDMLIDIWNIVVKNLNGYKLNIIGDGELKKELQEKIKKLRLEDSVFLKGEILDIKKEYLKADLCLSTSRYEGFGLTLIEAHSLGVPTIAFDCSPCIRDVINNGNGLVIPCYDLEQYSCEIIKLLSDKKKMKKISNLSVESCKKYSVESICEKWKKIFGDLENRR